MPEIGHTISSPCEPDGSGELKMVKRMAPEALVSSAFNSLIISTAFKPG